MSSSSNLHKKVYDLFVHLQSHPEDKERLLGTTKDPLFHERPMVLELLDAFEDVEAGMRAYGHDLEEGMTVGNFLLEELIGSGGMGSVFLATQCHPVQRLVALKFLHLGEFSEAAMRRFRAESQKLAAMNHNCIARMYGLEIPEDRAPFMVMEFVDGFPLTTFCEQFRLEGTQRLSLFGKICQAVAYAHSEGVVHLDLKPSNILVKQEDGLPVPKIIDFGIACSVQQDQQSEPHTLAGTPEYMSPEQFGHRNDGHPTSGMTPKSDVYSLGVILYELVCGMRPFMRSEEDADGSALRYAICHAPPPQLRAVLGKNQGPGRLKNIADLEAIVSKALSKLPNDRYESVTALRNDVERYLAAQPLSVISHTRWYLFRRSWQRNRGLFVGTSLVGLALAAGLLVSLMSYWKVKTAQSQTLEAYQQEQEIRQVLDEVLSSPHPRKSGNQFTVMEMLGDARRRIDGASLNPFVRSALLKTFGETYFALGEYDNAEASFTEALNLSASPRDAAQEEALLELVEFQARTMMHLGNPKAAASLIDKMRKKHAPFLQRNNLRRYSLLNTQGMVAQKQNELQVALALHEEALLGQQEVLGHTHITTLLTQAEVGNVRFKQRDFRKAKQIYQKVLQSVPTKRLESDPSFLSVLQNYATSLYRLGDYEECENTFERVLNLRKNVLPGSHPAILTSRQGLALCWWRRGKESKALEELKSVFLERQQKLGEDHPLTLDTLSNLARVCESMRKVHEALYFLRKRRLLAEAAGSVHNERHLRSINNEADLLIQAGQPTEAMELLEVALRLAHDFLPEENKTVLNLRCTLAQSVLESGDSAGSVKVLVEVVDAGFELLGATSSFPWMYQGYLAEAYMEDGHLHRAEDLVRESIACLPRRATVFRKKLMDIQEEILKRKTAEKNPPRQQ